MKVRDLIHTGASRGISGGGISSILNSQNIPYGDLFSILFVAFILTSGEIFYFYSTLVPQLNTKIDSGLKEVSNMVSCNMLREIARYFPRYDKYLINEETMSEQDKIVLLRDMLGQCDDIGECLRKQFTQQTYESQKKWITLLATISERERMLVDEINHYTLKSGFVIIFVLFYFLSSYTYKHGSLNWARTMFGLKPKRVTGHIAGMDVVGTFYTLIGIVMFQLKFIQIGKQYRLTSDQEIMVSTMNMILDNDESLIINNKDKLAAMCPT